MSTGNIKCGLKCWGGAFSNCKELKENGIKQGYYYFENQEDLQKFLDFLYNEKDKFYKEGLVNSKVVDEALDKKEWKASYKLKFNGMYFNIVTMLSSILNEEECEFYLTEGNQSCDCNKAVEIIRLYPYMKGLLDDIPCGDEIELSDLVIEAVDINPEENPLKNCYLCLEDLYVVSKEVPTEILITLKDLENVISKGNQVYYDEEKEIYITNKGKEIGELNEELLKKYFVKLV
jgi:hypothetical protein